MVDEEGKSEVEQYQGGGVEEDVKIGRRDSFGGARGLMDLSDRAVLVDTGGGN